MFILQAINNLKIIWPKFVLARVGGSRWVWRWLLAALTILPLAATWYNPFYLRYAIIGTIVLWLLVMWQQWAGWDRFVSWLVAGSVFLIYWSSILLMWLFLENYWYRIAMILLNAFFSLWYLREWQRLRLKVFLGEAGAGSTPTLVLSFMSCFALGSSAESLLVYLNTPLWQLLLAFYLPMAVLLICFIYTSGWSPIKKWPYWFTGLIIMLQIFILSTWWPTSFYVIGFSQATIFVLVALIMRQESHGFINRRSFIRELSLVMAVLLLVLISARWY